jgi:hypothetical protein
MRNRHRAVRGRGGCFRGDCAHSSHDPRCVDPGFHAPDGRVLVGQFRSRSYQRTYRRHGYSIGGRLPPRGVVSLFASSAAVPGMPGMPS